MQKTVTGSIPENRFEELIELILDPNPDYSKFFLSEEEESE